MGSRCTSERTATPLLWTDPITENPAVGATEEWEIYNVTEDAHPIHIHLVQFEVLGREAIGGGTSVAGSNDPLPWETGFKDTVISYPGEITRVKAEVRLPRLLCLALPHRRARGQRDDAAVPCRAHPAERAGRLTLSGK